MIQVDISQVPLAARIALNWIPAHTECHNKIICFFYVQPGPVEMSIRQKLQEEFKVCTLSIVL